MCCSCLSVHIPTVKRQSSRVKRSKDGERPRETPVGPQSWFSPLLGTKDLYAFVNRQHCRLSNCHHITVWCALSFGTHSNKLTMNFQRFVFVHPARVGFGRPIRADMVLRFAGDCGRKLLQCMSMLFNWVSDQSECFLRMEHFDQFLFCSGVWALSIACGGVKVWGVPSSFGCWGLEQGWGFGC